jgi:hypothetical protein
MQWTNAHGQPSLYTPQLVVATLTSVHNGPCDGLEEMMRRTSAHDHDGADKRAGGHPRPDHAGSERDDTIIESGDR